MKPFNLKQALAGKPVVTRDGRKVKIAGHNPDAEGHHILVGWIYSGDEIYSCNWLPSGRLFLMDSEQSADLFMATRTLWVRAFEREDGSVAGFVKEHKDSQELISSWRWGFKWLGPARPFEIDEE